MISVGIAVLAQFAFTYAPAMQSVFGTEKVAPADGVLIVGIGVALLSIVELEKRLFAWLTGAVTARIHHAWSARAKR